MKLASRIALTIARNIPRGYWPLIRMAARNDEALHDLRIPIKDYPGHHVRADLRETVYAPLFRWGELKHHSWLKGVFDEYVKEGACVFDVGANIGFVSLLMALRVGPSGTVHALEPGLRAFEFLRKNIEGVEQIVVHRLGAGDKVGTIGFHEQDSLDLSWTGDGDSEPSYNIEIVPLDEFAASHGSPSFIKIDVEGFEQSVFAGMPNILRESRPVILFEALDEAELRKSVSVLNRITSDGYEVRRASGARVNYLATPR